MQHNDFRTTIQDAMPVILKRLQDGADPLANMFDSTTESALANDPHVRKMVVALEQAISRSTSSLTQHGLMDNDDDRINRESVEFAWKQIAHLGIAYLIGMHIIQQTAEAMKAAYTHSQAERARIRETALRKAKELPAWLTMAQPPAKFDGTIRTEREESTDPEIPPIDPEPPLPPDPPFTEANPTTLPDPSTMLTLDTLGSQRPRNGGKNR